MPPNPNLNRNLRTPNLTASSVRKLGAPEVKLDARNLNHNLNYNLNRSRNPSRVLTHPRSRMSTRMSAIKIMIMIMIMNVSLDLGSFALSRG